MMIRTVLIILMIAVFAQLTDAQPLKLSYPFTISNSDTAVTGKLPTETPASPITSRLTAMNGHFYINAAADHPIRVRLFGTELLYTAQFLDSKHAATLAAHLHKLGFNAVRLWYNDYNYGLCYTDTKSSYNVNTSAFLILDTLLAALKQQGIYVFLTLHSEHSFSAADGIMHSDSGFVAPNGWFKQFYDARTAELYRQWSKSLLGHTNVVTKLRYADDPVIAGIEIDNQEYSFSLGWRNNYLNFKDSANIYPNGSATITFSESRKLDTLFTDYLIRKYGSENAINAAYAGPMPSSANLIEDGSFEDIGSTAWSFAVANGTTGGVVNISPGIDSQYCLLVHIKTIGANAGYGDAVLTNTSLRLKLDSLYEITFWARIKYIPSAPVLRDTLYMVMYDLPNYGTTLAQFQPIDTSWKQYSMTFRGIGDDAQILNCFLGKHLCDVELDGFSVHRKQEFGLFPFEHAASKTITRVTFGSTNLVPYQRYRDLFLFYDSLQQVYYAQTAKCIRDTVGTTMMINNYEASYWASYLDTYENRTSDYLGGGGNYDYAYTRPGKPYADSTFICINRSMLGDTYNYFLGTTEALPLDGKPFVSSNFLTPYINQHNQEALPFLAAYGSLHDWDGIFISWFAEYAQELDTNHTFTTAFYSLAGNAALQASAPAASDMFRNFKITPSTINVTVTHTDENMLLTGMVNRFSTPYGVDGFLDPGIGTMFKLRQSFGATKEKISSEYPYNPTTSDTAVKVSVTNELTWDQKKENFTANSLKYQAAIGYFLRDTVALHDVTFSRQDEGTDEIALSLSSIDTSMISVSSDLLLTIGTRTQNTGWIWDADSLGIGKHWGHEPVLFSSQTIEFAIACDSSRLVFTPLDSTGAAHRLAFDAVKSPGSNVFKITLGGATMRSPWYWVSRTNAVNAVRSGTANNSSLEIFPNPAAESTTLTISLIEAGRVKISVYDDLGRLREQILDGEFSGGEHNIPISTAMLEAGHYIVKCESAASAIVRSLEVVK